ncbi:MAG: flagellar hook-basal body complex protein FliE [Vampirovibrionales bacterium]|jgi:flagellar hook-basal body complex protein FliE|nr:flagellar hook-basal body complex protein FliE [Vampirovibrionales bacterium]
MSFNIGAISSIPLNTNQGLLSMGGHLAQTQGIMNGQAFQGVTMPPHLYAPTITPMNSVSGVGSFKDVMLNTVNGVNATTSKPNDLMRESMAGGKVDIHDVMMANTQSELAITLTSQVMTKVIQGYEKLSQIQI